MRRKIPARPRGRRQTFRRHQRRGRQDKEEAALERLRERGFVQVALERIVRDARLRPEEGSQLADHLVDLVRARILALRKGRLFLVGARRLKSGRLRAHVDGYAFLVTDDPAEEDYYVPRTAVRPAMHGDRVLAVVEPNRGRGPRAHVILVLQRQHRELVGTYHVTGGLLHIRPQEERIPYFVRIPRDKTGGARDGDLVIATIKRYPDDKAEIEAHVRQVLGPASDPRVQTDAVIARHDLPDTFPAAVIAAAAKIPPALSEKDYAGRLDLREETLFTVDGENARDFDDAIGLQPTRSGMRLRVSIADVAHYVGPGSVLDLEALGRGTSVYFPDRVLPMLPEQLSNGVCSLLPGVDRLTRTVTLDFDGQGQVRTAEFHDSVTRSAARLTYTNVKQMLVEKDPQVLVRHADLVPTLEAMATLATQLYEQRRRRGSIDFDLPEADVVLDLTGRPEAIVRAERHIGHRIIEEFMLAANEAVARELIRKEAPFLHRVHEAPDEDAVEELRRFVAGFGLQLAAAHHPSPKHFQTLLEGTTGRPEARLIHTLLLRSMKQARYAGEPLGHFGLATQAYTHFTSPIRRYPDLVVHRILRECTGAVRLPPERRAQLLDQLPLTAEHCSRRERVAMEAEREVIDLKKVQFMQGRLGETMPGFISGVLPFGLFVELADYLIEGLVHVGTLHDDHYVFAERTHAFRGRRTGRTFQLGDPLDVRVVAADPESRRIDFEVAEAPKGATQRRRPGRRDV